MRWRAKILAIMVSVYMRPAGVVATVVGLVLPFKWPPVDNCINSVCISIQWNIYILHVLYVSRKFFLAKRAEIPEGSHA